MKATLVYSPRKCIQLRSCAASLHLLICSLYVSTCLTSCASIRGANSYILTVMKATLIHSPRKCIQLRSCAASLHLLICSSYVSTCFTSCASIRGANSYILTAMKATLIYSPRKCIQLRSCAASLHLLICSSYVSTCFTSCASIRGANSSSISSTTHK